MTIIVEKLRLRGPFPIHSRIEMHAPLARGQEQFRRWLSTRSRKRRGHRMTDRRRRKWRHIIIVTGLGNQSRLTSQASTVLFSISLIFFTRLTAVSASFFPSPRVSPLFHSFCYSRDRPCDFGSARKTRHVGRLVCGSSRSWILFELFRVKIFTSDK